MSSHSAVSMPLPNLQWPPVSLHTAIDECMEIMRRAYDGSKKLQFQRHLYFWIARTNNGEPPSDLLDVCIGIANSGGGLVILGVAADGTLEGLTTPLDEAHLAQKLMSQTDPPFDCNPADCSGPTFSKISFASKCFGLPTSSGSFAVIAVGACHTAVIKWRQTLQLSERSVSSPTPTALDIAFAPQPSMKWGYQQRDHVQVHVFSQPFNDVQSWLLRDEGLHWERRSVMFPEKSNEHFAEPFAVIEAQLPSVLTSLMLLPGPSCVAFGLADTSGLLLPLQVKDPSFPDTIGRLIDGIVAKHVFPPLKTRSELRVVCYVISNIEAALFKDGHGHGFAVAAQDGGNWCTTKDLKEFRRNAALKEAVRAYEREVLGMGAATAADKINDTLPPLYPVRTIETAPETAAASSVKHMVLVPHALGEKLAHTGCVVAVSADSCMPIQYASVAVAVHLLPHKCVDPTTFRSFVMHECKLRPLSFLEIWRRRGGGYALSSVLDVCGSDCTWIAVRRKSTLFNGPQDLRLPSMEGPLDLSDKALLHEVLGEVPIDRRCCIVVDALDLVEWSHDVISLVCEERYLAKSGLYLIVVVRDDIPCKGSAFADVANVLAAADRRLQSYCFAYSEVAALPTNNEFMDLTARYTVSRPEVVKFLSGSGPLPARFLLRNDARNPCYIRRAFVNSVCKRIAEANAALQRCSSGVQSITLCRSLSGSGLRSAVVAAMIGAALVHENLRIFGVNCVYNIIKRRDTAHAYIFEEKFPSQLLRPSMSARIIPLFACRARSAAEVDAACRSLSACKCIVIAMLDEPAPEHAQLQPYLSAEEFADMLALYRHVLPDAAHALDELEAAARA